MSTSITVRAIQATARTAADSGLKSAGFRWQGNHLHRTVGSLVHAINFQASQWGSASSGSFTVNLAVASSFLYTTWTGRPFPSNPGSALFPVNSRIGHLMPPRKDQWWDVDERTDVDALVREVTGAILKYGLPFFESFKSAPELLLRLRDGKGLPGLTDAQAPLVHAMLALEAGARHEASELLKKAYATAEGSLFRETVQVISGRLGIPLG